MSRIVYVGQAAKAVLVASLILCVASGSFAKVGLRDLAAVPREVQIGQFVCERTHTRPTRTLSRDDFLRYLREGRLAVGGSVRNEIFSRRFEPVRPDQPSQPSAAVFCQGAFATLSGEVFLWRLVKERVLEIEDSDHHTGWLIIDQGSAPKTTH